MPATLWLAPTSIGLTVLSVSPQRYILQILNPKFSMSLESSLSAPLYVLSEDELESNY